MEGTSSGELPVLTESNWKDAGTAGLFGFVVHGIGGNVFYNLLEDFVSGSTPIPIAIKTFVDVFLFLPFLSVAHDRFIDFANGNGSDLFGGLVKRGSSSSSAIFKRSLIWLPAQAISFALLPPCWRVGYTSIIMVLCSFFNLIRWDPVVEVGA